MIPTLALLGAVDDLYRRVVEEPAAWPPARLAEWAEDVGSGGPTREQARLLRRCLRVAEKLQRHWADPARSVGADDWRSRVDVALGPPAWRPTLELAELGLETEPSPELYEEVGTRFRVVHSRPFMDGIGYEEWAVGQRSRW